MELLITGRTAEITAPFCDRLGQRHKVVLASEDVPTLRGRRATPFKMSPHEKGFEKLFHSYSFGAVFFFSQRPEEQNEYYDELQDLEYSLRLCSEHNISKFVYISSTSVYAGLDSFNENTEPIPVDGKGVVLSACEKLCEFYRLKHAMSVIILHTPSLFGYGETVSVAGSILSSAVKNASVRINARENQVCEFLSQEDLSEFFMRLLDDWTEEYPVINLPGASSITFGQMAQDIKTSIPSLRVSYTGLSAHIANPAVSNIARREYDWVPVYNISEEIPRIISVLRGTEDNDDRSLINKISDFFKRHKFIIRLAELLLGFFVMELLNYWTRTSVQFQYIDFRLLYVVVLGSVHGLKTGLGAALLACVSCLMGYMSNGVDWLTIAYNIDNWLPFACYVIVGAIVGYTKDKLTNDIVFVKEEKSVLEEKYIFLNELYSIALQNKGQFKNQIMSYRDSFGRIFEVTRKLNNTLPDAVFKEALSAMEDILENNTICIYSLDKYMHYGRLIVCSKKISAATTKSINLDNYGYMMKEFRDGEVWSNVQRLMGYPEYAAPIFRDGTMVALITIQKTKYEQMAMYYENLIKVLCGLIQVSLLRALEYNEHLDSEIYLPGTRIMNKEHFREVLELKVEMEEENVSEYSLLHINSSINDKAELSNLIMSTLRTTDILGEGEDGELYIILSQTNSENAQFVIKRLMDAGIRFTDRSAEESM